MIDLIFLHTKVKKFNNHYISPDLRNLSDHAPLLVSIIIEKEFIKERQQTIVKNSEEEKKLLKSLKTR